MPLALITLDKLRCYLADGELDAFDNAGSDDTRPLPERVGGLIRKACNKVALYVNSRESNGRLNLNQDAVPEELEDSTLAIARNMLLADMPDMSDMEGSPRAKAYSNAIRELQDVANGILKLTHFVNISGGTPENKKVLAASEPYMDWNNL